MTEAQFQVVLGVIVTLIVAQVLYTEKRTKEQRERDFAKKFGWLKALPPWKLRVFLVLAIALVGAGLTGLTGMFFFFKWAATLYLAATLVAKIGSYVWFKSNTESHLAKALKHGVTAAEGALFYLIFFGPAKALFK